MEPTKPNSGIVLLRKSWIWCATGLLALETTTLIFLALHASSIGPQCPDPCTSPPDLLDNALVALSAAAGTNSLSVGKHFNDSCYMGGILAPPAASTHTVKKILTPNHDYKANSFPQDDIPFSELLCNSKSDKQIHFFGHMYSEYLDPLRLHQEEVHMLEIGLRYGDSLNLWLSAFPKGMIYGLDAFHTDVTQNLKRSMLGKRVRVFKGDQEDLTVLKKLATRIKAEVGFLDFVVDDGGHTMRQQINSFTHLFPLVKPGGFYFIEDLQTSYWAKKCHIYYNGLPYCYGGGPPGAKNTTVDLLKSLVDVLNADFMEDHEGIGELGSGTFSVNPVDRLVGSIQCWRNLCVVRRKHEHSHF